MEQISTPVLLLIYKRISTTRQVIEQVRKARPSKIYISANGFNPKDPTDKVKCEEARSIVNEIDWPCEVIKNFRMEHFSAKESITAGINWFFEHVKEGIILEDDCVVDPSFFSFCQELLEKYRDHPQVMHIGASNFQQVKRGDGSYYFSRFNHIWGWAGWRKSWSGYDVNLKDLGEKEFVQTLNEIFTRKQDRAHWLEIYKYLKSGNVDTWDTQYMFHLWRRKGISILPNVNLVKNVGFGKEATNTQSPLSRWANLEVGGINQIVHPKVIEIDQHADEYTSDVFYNVSESAKYFNLKLKLARHIPISLKRRIKNLLG